MLNSNTTIYIIKCTFYCIFYFPPLPPPFFVHFLSPQLFWHCFPFFRCFTVTITPLLQNTDSSSFILLTMPFPSFTLVFSSNSYDLCFSSGLFILFHFSYLSSFPSAFSNRLLSIISLPLCGILFIYLSATSFLLFVLFLLLYLLSSLLFPYILQFLKGRI